MAESEGIQIKMIMPAEQQESLWEELDSGGRKMISGSVEGIDVENADASRLDDKLKVKKAIQDTVGFHGVNESVKNSMVTMLGKAAFRQ